MAICHFIVAGIIGSYSGDFENHRGAGWAAVVFVWLFIINFAYSWGEFEPDLSNWAPVIRFHGQINTDQNRACLLDRCLGSFPIKHACKGR